MIQPHEEDESFVKLSWVCIKDYKVLFVRAPGGKVFFDPGCRRVEGRRDEEALAEKIKLELGVELLEPFIKVMDFKAPAYAKPEGTMAEARCFLANFRGTLTLTEHIEEMSWFINSQENRNKTSDLGKALLQQLSIEGLID